MKKLNRKSLIIIASIVAVLAVVFIVGYSLTGSEDVNKNNISKEKKETVVKSDSANEESAENSAAENTEEQLTDEDMQTEEKTAGEESKNMAQKAVETSKNDAGNINDNEKKTQNSETSTGAPQEQSPAPVSEKNQTSTANENQQQNENAENKPQVNQQTKIVGALISAIGQPISKSYASSCIGDGQDGEWIYQGFTVYTYRDTNGSERVEDVMAN